MTENDIKTGKELLQEAFIMKNPKWMKELQIMVSCPMLFDYDTMTLKFCLTTGDGSYR